MTEAQRSLMIFLAIQAGIIVGYFGAAWWLP